MEIMLLSSFSVVLWVWKLFKVRATGSGIASQGTEPSDITAGCLRVSWGTRICHAYCPEVLPHLNVCLFFECLPSWLNAKPFCGCRSYLKRCCAATLLKPPSTIKIVAMTQYRSAVQVLFLLCSLVVPSQLQLFCRIFLPFQSYSRNKWN